MYDYNDHQEIPGTIQSYIMTIADADYIGEVPIQEINDFLNGLEEQERQGW